jgi:hypothetical protein
MYQSSSNPRLSLELPWMDENFDTNLEHLTLIWKKGCLEDKQYEAMLLSLLNYIRELYTSSYDEGRNRYERIMNLSLTGFCEKGICQCRHLQLVVQFKMIIGQINASESSDSLRECKEEIKAYKDRYDSLLYSLQKLPHKQTVCNEMSAAKDKNMNQLNDYLKAKEDALQAPQGAVAGPSVKKKRKRAGDSQSAGSSLIQAQLSQPALFSAAGPSYSYSNQLTIASELPSSLSFPFPQSDTASNNRGVVKRAATAAPKNHLLSHDLIIDKSQIRGIEVECSKGDGGYFKRRKKTAEPLLPQYLPTLAISHQTKVNLKNLKEKDLIGSDCSVLNRDESNLEKSEHNNSLVFLSQRFREQQKSLAKPSKMMQDDPEKGFDDAKKILENMRQIFNKFESKLPSTLLNNSHKLKANEWLTRAQLVLHVTEDRIHYAYAKALTEKSRLIPSPNKKLLCLKKALDSLQRYDEDSTGCEVATGLLIDVRSAHYLVAREVPIYDPKEDHRQMTDNLTVIGEIRGMIKEQLRFFNQGGQHRGFPFVSKESENQGEPTPQPGCSHWR